MNQIEIYEQIRRLDSNAAITEAAKAKIRVDMMAAYIEDKLACRKFDAGETANLARALLYLRAQSVDVEYAKSQFRNVLPVNTSVPEGATSYSVPSFDMVGQAKLIVNYGDDLPMVDVKQSETTVGIHRYGASYEYSVQDLASSAMSGIMLDQKRQQAARDVIERKHDVIACTGDTAANLGGFANATGVDNVSLANVGTWAAKAAANTGWKIVADIQAAQANIVGDTQGLYGPDTIACDAATEFLMRTTTMGTTGDNRTVLKALLDAGINLNVVQWQRLALSDAGGDGPRVIIYKKDPNVAEYVAPSGGFTEEAPQARNLAYVINCHGRSAGACVYRPKAVSYLDVG
jgi:hypothetical protein